MGHKELRLRIIYSYFDDEWFVYVYVYDWNFMFMYPYCCSFTSIEKEGMSKFISRNTDLQSKPACILWTTKSSNPLRTIPHLESSKMGYHY